MSQCEMCGKITAVAQAEVEGGILAVCSGCAQYGKVLQGGSRLVHKQSFRPVKREEPALNVVDNYASLLHSFRERKKMTQEEFAKFLQERESSVIKWEQGTMKPSVDAARKLEKMLGVRLVGVEEAGGSVQQSGKKSDEFTLGDFIKVRKRN